MALNQCVNCDEWFNETTRNPGNICPECKKEQEEKDKENVIQSEE